MPPESSLKRTPLYSVHVALGARMVPFAGFLMPVQYTSIIEEHMAVRTAVGAFDVSHMGEIYIEGPGATDRVDRLVPRAIRSLEPGQVRYTVLLREDGGILDDLLVYRLDTDRWLLVVNAANIDKDFAWIADHAGPVPVRNASDETALIAVQGPRAVDVVPRVVRGDPEKLRYYRFLASDSDGIPVLCSRTGYTGEDGFELYISADQAETIWQRLFEVGASRGLRPCGLGARDTLRLEAGMLLYGNDMDESTNPFEVGLDWVVNLEKGDFIGRDALLRIREQGVARLLVGFEMVDAGIARHGYPVYDAAGNAIGRVTSGTMAPYLRKAIGMALVRADAAGPELWIEIRGTRRRARIVDLPFYRRPKPA